MSECNCGQVDIPLGMTGMTAGGITHGVTACVSGWAEQSDALRRTGRCDMSGCYCGEFDRPTIAPDEFGETCFHERGKCEVPPVPVPIETVLRLTRARAEQAEAAIARVREKPYLNARPHGQPEPWREGYNQALREVLRALNGATDV